MKLTKTKLRAIIEEVMAPPIFTGEKYMPRQGEQVMAYIDDEPEIVTFRRFDQNGYALVRRRGDDNDSVERIDPNLIKPHGPPPMPGIGNETEDETNKAYRRNPEFFNEVYGDVSEERIESLVIEELNALLEEKKKKKSAKDKMKCNSPRRIRKGEAGHGKKKFVVKACDGGTEKIIRYGDAGLKIKRKQKGRRKNFRARHNCDNPGSKLKARYWSCKNW